LAIDIIVLTQKTEFTLHLARPSRAQASRPTAPAPTGPLLETDFGLRPRQQTDRAAPGLSNPPANLSDGRLPDERTPDPRPSCFCRSPARTHVRTEDGMD